MPGAAPRPDQTEAATQVTSFRISALELMDSSQLKAAKPGGLCWDLFAPRGSFA